MILGNSQLLFIYLFILPPPIMATSRLISSHLRRRTPPLFSLLRSFSLLNHTSPPSHPPPSTTSSFRFFSSHSPDSDFNTELNSVFNHDMNSVTESELRNLGFIDGGDVSAAAAATGGLLEDSMFPIRAIVSLLDGYHELSGLPWWIVIASSTVALRAALLPVVILQLQKLKQIGEAFPKLPPPLPPPFSGKSYVDQYSLFRRERKALGCPSFLWFLASHTVQIPCFILWMLSIRRMSLDGFPGFDTGGILWFQDLTVPSHGVLGSVLPFLVAGLHFCNVQIAFRGSSVGNQTGVLQMLAKWYRKYLEVLTLPLLFAGFYVPQGSLIYWVTNSSLTLVQQVCLQHPATRKRLGLVNKEALPSPEESEKDANPTVDAPMKKGAVSAFELSPLELVHHAVIYLSTNKTEKAILLLRLAVEKDPDCYRAWTVLGDVMIRKGLFDEATEYAECAISKICLLGEPYNDEAIDFLIQAYVIAGGALYRLGKPAEALVHFERLRDMKEPEYPAAKARYYEGLMVYARYVQPPSFRHP
ncbi:hypothetical protein RND81_04G228600 [Saponaria officinalis]|uniref:ALBINO3-like protein 2, chloroplastic n=1 Tax=Saponaria officinalis TaxID=3572 RepID=A0AAW1LP36_SAPOF